MSDGDNIFTPSAFSGSDDDPAEVGDASDSGTLSGPVISADQCSWDEDDSGGEGGGDEHSTLACEGDTSEERHDAPLAGQDDEALPRRKGNDDTLVEALAQGMTQKEAGRQAGMSERTVSRRLKEEPDLAERVSERRAELAAERRHKLRRLGGRALDGRDLAMSRAMELVELGRSPGPAGRRSPPPSSRATDPARVSIWRTVWSSSRRGRPRRRRTRQLLPGRGGRSDKPPTPRPHRQGLAPI